MALENRPHIAGRWLVRPIHVDRAARDEAVSSSGGAGPMDASEKAFVGAVFHGRHSVVLSRTVQPRRNDSHGDLSGGRLVRGRVGTLLDVELAERLAHSGWIFRNGAVNTQPRLDCSGEHFGGGFCRCPWSWAEVSHGKINLGISYRSNLARTVNSPNPTCENFSEWLLLADAQLLVAATAFCGSRRRLRRARPSTRSSTRSCAFSQPGERRINVSESPRAVRTSGGIEAWVIVAG